jgi:uncharacterized protein involved in response to NO
MMTTTAEQYRAYRGPALFSMGFRPFFLFASAWAALAVPIWLVAYIGILPAAHLSREWHVHEMLFGYLGGVVAGFLLTAVPNWTGRLPVAGAPLAALFALWAAGRFAMLFENELGVAAAVIDCAFLFALAAIVAREVFAGKNKRNFPVTLLVTVLSAANVLSHLSSIDPELVRLGERIGLGVIAMLMTLIGGRIVPSFTRNWMAKRKMVPEPAPADRYDALALVVAALALASWIVAPDSLLAGGSLFLAGVLQIRRLGRWRGWRTAAEPLVLVLHFGYAWLALAFVLLGLGVLAPSAFPATAGVHALTAGAFGVMTLAVMTRATRGHTGRELTAPWGTQLIYVSVNLGAILRVAAALLPGAYLPLLIVSAAFWSLAFGLFIALYARPLTSRLPARRHA